MLQCHPSIMQASGLLHGAQSHPYRTNTFCLRIFSNVSKRPVSPWPPELDLRQRENHAGQFLDTQCSAAPPIASPIAFASLESQSCPLLYYGSGLLFKIHPEVDNSFPLHHYRDCLSHHHSLLVLLQLTPISLFPPWFSSVCIKNSSHSNSFGNASYITYTINPLLNTTLHRLPLHWVKSKVLTLVCENLCDLPLCHSVPATSWLLPLLRPKLEIFLPSQPYIK